ncbi:MAG: OmpA family protein [Massilia sp.]
MNPNKHTALGSLAWLTLVAVQLAGCGKKEAAPVAVPAPASVVPSVPGAGVAFSAGAGSSAAPAPAASAASVPVPAASTDPDSPTALPAREIRGVGIKRQLSYYYLINAQPGTINLTATAKNAPSGATQALAFGLLDARANKLCSESHGNTTTDKTLSIACPVDKAQPLLLRLDLGEETIGYTVTLAGSFELPPAQAGVGSVPVAGAGSTDIDAPTILATNRIRGAGAGKRAAYFYAFNAGPGELFVTGDGKNTSAAVADALAVGLVNLRSEKLCDLSLGNTTIDKRGVMSCRFEQRQPVILRLDLAPETVDYRVKFEGPYDFEPFTRPAAVTIALDAAVLFDTGKSNIKPEAQNVLGEAAARIRKFGGAGVTIGGHTDNVGKAAANQLLSEQRAAAVKVWLIGREGVPAAGLVVKGYGKSQPVADNASEAGRARNRRVDVVITPAAR